VGFGGEGNSGGVYHSAYDTFEHFSRFGDPGFAYEVALAELGGRLVLRAADADLAPYQFASVAATISREVRELKTLTGDEREEAKMRDKLLDAKAYALSADPTEVSAPPPREEPVPELDFTSLDAAVAKLTASAKAYDAAAAGPVTAANARAANAILQGTEQALTDPRGLPGRPWYQNLIYAPGVLTGYGAKTLPGVREAIESHRWAEAKEFIGRTAGAIDALSAKLDAATKSLSAS
jgi:N-acetylated-alpha-linked acidic dipeptidase